MIVVIEGSNGYTIADDGQVLAHLTEAKADELRARLADALHPVNTGAVTPAKYAARNRPPIMRYPLRATK